LVRGVVDGEYSGVRICERCFWNHSPIEPGHRGPGYRTA
jgi:hypothetical protein